MKDVFLTIKALKESHRQKLVRYSYQKACKNLMLTELQGSIAVKEIKSIKRNGREEDRLHLFVLLLVMVYIIQKPGHFKCSSTS